MVSVTQSRHEPICIKSGQKKRRVFDSSKQRAEGTELKQFQKKNPLGKAPPAGKGNNAPVGIRQPAVRIRLKIFGTLGYMTCCTEYMHYM